MRKPAISVDFFASPGASLYRQHRRAKRCVNAGFLAPFCARAVMPTSIVGCEDPMHRKRCTLLAQNLGLYSDERNAACPLRRPSKRTYTMMSDCRRDASTEGALILAKPCAIVPSQLFVVLQRWQRHVERWAPHWRRLLSHDHGLFENDKALLRQEGR